MPVDPNRVEQIFDAALARPLEQRSAYLNEACGDDSALRARVEALLRAHQAADGFLNPPSVETLAAAGVTEKAGAVIGRYKLLQLIGEGGFGSVFMAEQQHPVRRRVALKIIKLGMDTRQVVARFEAERQALAMMDHPNIAKVLDAGATDTGRPFFVMELVKGVPIVEYCDTNNLSTGERLALFTQICRAIQHAHQKGIIHRDIKPSNVLVTLADGVPIPKVIDFGIAKATQARLTERTLFTEFKQLVGTPEYMSPEQAEMTGIDIDTRSDIYSLGVLLYELLTGTTPISAQQLRSQAFAEMQRMIREVEPPRPSTRLSTLGDALTAVAAHRRTDPRKLRRAVTGELDWIVMKCLEKDRMRRYETANALALDIERHLTHEPVLARPATAGYRLAKFVRRNKLGVGAAAAVTLALCVGIVGTSVGLVRARRAEGHANVQKQNALGLLKEVETARSDAEKQARRATAARDYMTNMFRAPQPQAKGGEVKLVDVLATAARNLDTLNEQPEVELDLRLTLARTYEALALGPDAVVQYNRALELARRVGGADSEQALAIVADLVFILEDDSAQGPSMADDALRRARQSLGPLHPVTLDIRNSQGVALMRNGMLDEAEAVFRELVDLARKQPLDLRPKGTARFRTNLASVLGLRGQAEASEKLSREAVEVAAREAGTDARRDGTYFRELGEKLARKGDLAEAMPNLRRAYERHRDGLGPTHPETAISMGRLISALERADQFEESTKLRQAALAALPRSEWTNPLFQLATADGLLRLGREREADELLGRAGGSIRASLLKGDYTLELAHQFWVSAALIRGLPPGQPWASEAIRSNVIQLVRSAVYNRCWNNSPLDVLEWDALQFELRPYRGLKSPDAKDAAAHGLGPPVAKGVLKELRALPTPAPGCYLLSICLPRRGGDPVYGVTWILLQPFDVAVHPNPGLVYSGSEASWKKLFDVAHAERRVEPTLSFLQLSPLLTGFGHAKASDGFSLAITARQFHLPYGEYRLQVYAGQYTVLANGLRIGDARGGELARPIQIDFRDGKPGELRIEASGDLTQVLVQAIPLDPAMEPVVNSFLPPVYALRCELEQLDAELEVASANGTIAAPQYVNRSILRGRVGMFRESVEDRRKAYELDPQDHYSLYYQACLLAYLDDRERHRAVCRELMTKFGTVERPEVLERNAKAALLIAGTDDDARLDAMTEKALQTGKGDFVPWFKLARGLSFYRQGHYEKAIEVLASVAQDTKRGEYVYGPARYLRAMSLLKLGRTGEARSQFEKAEAGIAAANFKPGERDPGESPENYAVMHLIAREARAMFPRTPPGDGEQGTAR